MPRYPDGLGEFHERDRPVRRMVNWIALFGLLALLVLAATGLLGGGSRPVTSVRTPAADLAVKTPSVLRSGMFFEAEIQARVKQPVAKPVLAISESYWRDITINTILPAATGEKSEEGMVLLEFDAMEAGDVLTLKIDGQINPSLFAGTHGRIELRDDERLLAAIPLELTVLP